MATAMYKAEKSIGKNNLGLWRIKMRSILTQQWLSDALEGDKLFKEGMDKLKRAEVMERAHGAIILYLGDEVLREVVRETSVTTVWRTLRSKEMQRALVDEQENAAESLNVKYMPKKRFKKSGANAEKNEGNETRSCHYCKKPGHLKRYCYAWKKKQAQEEQAENSADFAEDVDEAEMFNIVMIMHDGAVGILQDVRYITKLFFRSVGIHFYVTRRGIACC